MITTKETVIRQKPESMLIAPVRSWHTSKTLKNFESEGNINETFAHLSPSMGNLTFAYICHLAGEILPDYTSPFLTLRLCLPTIAKTAGSMCTGNGDTELATVLMMFPIKRPRVAPTYLHDKRKLAFSADLSLWIQSMSSEASLSYILYNRNLGWIIYNNICACLLSIKGWHWVSWTSL